VKISFRVNRQWLYNFADVVCALRAACRGARRRRPYIWARRTDRRLLVFATQKIPKRNLREKHDGPFSSVSVTAKNITWGNSDHKRNSQGITVNLIMILFLLIGIPPDSLSSRILVMGPRSSEWFREWKTSPPTRSANISPGTAPERNARFDNNTHEEFNIDIRWWLTPAILIWHSGWTVCFIYGIK
jgi:hypothetical protein